MKAADIPETYDALLQRLIRAQDASMMMPPFLDPHVAVVKAVSRWFKKGGYAEELSRALGSKQPNMLRSSFAGVGSILDELEAYAPPDLNALKTCHEANRRRMERRFRVSGIIVAVAAVFPFLKRFGTSILPEISRFKEFHEILLYICGATVVFILFLWIMSFSMLRRLEVLSDLFQIVLQKKTAQSN
jgi:hypothetical protein